MARSIVCEALKQLLSLRGAPVIGQHGSPSRILKRKRKKSMKNKTQCHLEESPMKRVHARKDLVLNVIDIFFSSQGHTIIILSTSTVVYIRLERHTQSTSIGILFLKYTVYQSWICATVFLSSRGRVSLAVQRSLWLSFFW
jgi:hypothetical protein